MKKGSSRVFIWLTVLALLIATGLQAAEEIPVELKEVGIEEHLGESISLDLEFIDEQGKNVLLGTYFKPPRPVILTLVYHNCPNLCHFLLDGFTQSLRQLKWNVGEEFEILTVSIDPTEKTEFSLKKKRHRVKKYGRPSAAEGWHFLTGTEKNIQQLAKEVGFNYRYDSDQNEYAHSAAIFILTPEGKISRYLYGIQFKKLDLKLALLEASEGKIGNVVDKFLLFCYHYDPKGRKYAIFAVNLMKLGAVAMLLILGSFLAVLFRRKKQVI